MSNIFKGIKSIPFKGNKWKYRIELKNILYDKLKDYKGLFIDSFGGSGSLSLVFKCLYPESKIILNDYDEIIEKDNKNLIDDSIKKANEILDEIRSKLKPEDIEGDKIINGTLINNILDKYKDYLKDKIVYSIISSNICFNGRFKLNGNTYWNRIVKKNYNMYYDNFDGIEIIHKDFEEIFKEHENEDLIYILDPPYLYSELDGYDVKYWKLDKYLNLLAYILKHTKQKFIIFEGKKSNLNDMFKFFEMITNQKINYEKFNIGKNEFVILINF